MKHYVFYDTFEFTLDGVGLWVRKHLECPDEMTAHREMKLLQWKNKVRNVKVYPEHHPNKI